MILQSLSNVDILKGTFSLIFVVISLILGFKLLAKYFQYKDKVLLTVSLSWIFLCSPWWSPAFNFLSILLLDTTLEPALYLFLMTAFVPIALMCWIYSFGSLMSSNYEKKIISIYFIICLGYLIAYLILFIINPDFIAINTGGTNFRRTLFNLIFLVFAIISTLITGYIFSFHSLRSDDPKIQWKGKFIFIAFTSFVIGAMMDTLAYANYSLQLTARIILSLSAICYYLGFFLPKFMEKIFIKE